MTDEMVRSLHAYYPSWNTYEYHIMHELQIAEDEGGYQLLNPTEIPQEGSTYFYSPDDEEIIGLEISDDTKNDPVSTYGYPLFRKVDKGEPFFKSPNYVLIAGLASLR